MRVVSYNIQHLNRYGTSEIDKPLFARTLRALNADIIGLNEVRGAGRLPGYTNQTAFLSGELEMYACFAQALRVGGSSPYGNALLSRYPILRAETMAIPLPEKNSENGKYYEPRCVLKALVDGPEAPVTVLVTHFGLSEEEQALAVQTVLGALEEKRCILMGDFNVPPDDPCLSPLREALTDTAALLPKGQLSFPSDAPTVRIDHLFVTRDLIPVYADIPAITASDHRPYVAEFREKD